MEIIITAKRHEAQIVKNSIGELEVKILDGGIVMPNPDRDQWFYKSNQMDKAISDTSQYNEKMFFIHLADRKEGEKFFITQKYVSSNGEQETEDSNLM